MAYEHFRHRLHWDGRPVAGFATMSTLMGATAGTVRLERGVTLDTSFGAWASEGAADDAARMDVVVDTFDETGQQVGSVTLRRCRVNGFQALAELDSADNAVAVELISFQHEGVGLAASSASASTAIADVSSALRDVLRSAIASVRLPGVRGNVPVRLSAPTPSGAGAGAGAGAEETALHVFLHRVTQSQAWQQTPPRSEPDGRIAMPALVLDLHYLVCVSAAEDLHPELLLGAAALTLHRSPMLAVPGPDAVDRSVPVTMEPLTTEQLADVAASLGTAAQPMLAYRASVRLGQDTVAVSAPPMPAVGSLSREDANGVVVVDRPFIRVDLAAVRSRYVDETERNLAALFDEAERSGAILLFDEADALFGKRTDVRDSHDKYANQEVSYLLQRLESFRGLAIVATGSGSEAIDPAVVDRLRRRALPPLPPR